MIKCVKNHVDLYPYEVIRSTEYGAGKFKVWFHMAELIPEGLISNDHHMVH